MRDAAIECSIDHRSWSRSQIAMVEYNRHIHVLHEMKRLGAAIEHDGIPLTHVVLDGTVIPTDRCAEKTGGLRRAHDGRGRGTRASGKNTIYRRWSGKAELVIDAINSAKGPSEFPDTGSLREDLREVARITATAEDQFDAQVVVGMVSALTRDDELRRVHQVRFVEPRTVGLRRVLDRAVARGEMSADWDPDMVANLFHALVLQQLLVTGEAPGLEFMQRVMDEIVLPLATAPHHAG